MRVLDQFLASVPPALRKLIWFVLLWLMGVAVVTAVAFAIRTMIL